MRMSRNFFKDQKEGCYLHLYNRTVRLNRKKFSFTDKDKSGIFNLLMSYLKKYNLEVISFSLMPNHFHCILFSPAEKMTREQAHEAYNNFHYEKCQGQIPIDDPNIEKVMQRSNDISAFMCEFQGGITRWYNEHGDKNYERTGALWESRFKCKLVASDQYLWTLVRYVEMNPVRANLVDHPGDYHFSTYGQWQKSGKHPFEKNFLKHIGKLVKGKYTIDSLRQFCDLEFRRLILSDEIAADTGEDKRHQRQLLQQLDSIVKQQLALEADIHTEAIKDMYKGQVIGSEKDIRQRYNNWYQRQRDG